MPEKGKFLPEYEAFTELEHWQPLHALISSSRLFAENNQQYPFCAALYNKTEELYGRVPPRKNGENSLVHPLNVVWNLKKAGVTDLITLCAGLMHDYIEEQVDMYKKLRRIADTAEGSALVDAYEQFAFKRSDKEILDLCQKMEVPARMGAQLIEALHLLTKHKRHFYYKYISAIFNARKPVLRERVLQVKLADRMHNILCLDCFGQEERIYQCFKNLFILNNAKNFLLHSAKRTSQRAATEKLFKKCGKSTYDAFLIICRQASTQEVAVVQAMVELAFHKFAIEKKGLKKITAMDPREMHPMRLFHAVVRKYDARLHHEYELFERMKKQEREYCRRFFANYNFTPPQLQALIDYKDAYALKEVVARLLYDPNYVISGFLVQQLSRTGRIKR